ncbi:MAG: type III-A CRISPR-associated RAMP protein Csm3 [Anaerolineae bacterium]
MSEEKRVKLAGRVVISGKIIAKSGLHIGGSAGALAIGGVDMPVIRDPVTQQPYIPGSSLRGKMRSQWEKLTGVVQNTSIGKQVKIHTCSQANDYERCPVCPIYGVTGDKPASFPTRLLVRDVPLDSGSLKEAKTDLPFTEVKWEAAIDRVTSAATPRQIERVPAGAVFTPMEIVFNIYEEQDAERLKDVITAMQLVEDDYLGGHGSRGSGKVAFEELDITCKVGRDYEEKSPDGVKLPAKLAEWKDEHKKKLSDWVRETVFGTGK